MKLSDLIPGEIYSTITPQNIHFIVEATRTMDRCRNLQDGRYYTGGRFSYSTLYDWREASEDEVEQLLRYINSYIKSPPERNKDDIYVYQ